MNTLLYGNPHQIVTFHNLKINYWSIPKCGSTTLKYVLHKADIDETIFNEQKKKYATNDDVHSWVHAINICEKIELNDALKNEYLDIMVVRNPIDRLISLYNDFFVKRKNNNVGGSIDFKNKITVLRKNPSIDGLLKILEHIPNEQRDVHFKSQSWFYVNKNIKLIKLENIDYEIHKINNKINIDNLSLHETNTAHSVKIEDKKHILDNDFILYEKAN